MQPQDAERVAILAKSIWSDAPRAVSQSLDTIGAVSLLNLPTAAGMTRAARALLARGLQDGVNAGASRVAEPFFRLTPEERFVMAAITHAKISYSRVAEIMEVSVSDLEEMLWGVRLSLAHAHGGVSLSAISSEPTCPEVHAARPWTQAYLDDETTGRQKWFLESHARSCTACAKRLSLTRDILFRATKSMPELEPTQSEKTALNHTLLQARAIADPTGIGFVESLRLFWMRPETKLKFAAALGALALIITLRR